MTTTSPSRLLRAAPYFPVADVNATGEYYVRILGFSLEYGAGSEFAVYARDGCSVMFRRVALPQRIRPMES